MRDKKQRAKRARRDAETSSTAGSDLHAYEGIHPARAADIDNPLNVIAARIHRSVGLPSFQTDRIILPAVCFKGHVYFKNDAYRHHLVLYPMYQMFGGLLEGETEGFLTADLRFVAAIAAKEIVRLLQQPTVASFHDYRLLAEELWP